MSPVHRVSRPAAYRAASATCEDVTSSDPALTASRRRMYAAPTDLVTIPLISGEA